jgi:hypothetical protein
MPFMRKKTVDAIQNSARSAEHDAKMIVNSVTRQLDAFAKIGLSHGGDRDLYAVYGYPRVRDYAMYYEQYQSGDIANAIVAKPARSCWRDKAYLTATQESDESISDDIFNDLDKIGMFDALEKADILNRIGSYSLLYIGGLPGEVNRAVDGTANLKDIYFSQWSQDSAQIDTYDTDMGSRRYGLPTSYTLTPTCNDGNSNAIDTRQGMKVHWSRIVHLAEGSLDNNISGISSLEPVFNRLLDIQKVIGGAGEAYYINMARKFLMEIDKETVLPEGYFEETAEMAQEYINNQEIIMGAKGAKITAVSVSHADPTGTVTVAMQAISGATGIPIRILTGEGAGQLAGNEDKASWNQLISDRQNQVCAGWLDAVLAILANANAITLPEVYYTKWPKPEAMDELTQAEVNLKEAETADAYATALNKYTLSPGVQNIIGEEQFAEEIMHLDPDEVAAGRKDMEDTDNDIPEGE